MNPRHGFSFLLKETPVKERIHQSVGKGLLVVAQNLKSELIDKENCRLVKILTQNKKAKDEELSTMELKMPLPPEHIPKAKAKKK